MTIARDHGRVASRASIDGGGLAAPRSVRVAIVEDDADIRTVLSSLLQLWGHQVVGEASTGPDGVPLLVSTRPDVALIDIGLPGLDGYSVAEQARAVLRDQCPRLVAMTGLDRADRAEDGAFDLLLTKPPEPGALRAVLIGTALEPGPAVAR